MEDPILNHCPVHRRLYVAYSGDRYLDCPQCAARLRSPLWLDVLTGGDGTGRDRSASGDTTVRPDKRGLLQERQLLQHRRDR